MKITDKEVQGLLDKHRLYELEMMLEEYPEDERDGRTDMEMFRNELEWLVEKYTGEGWSQREEVKESREILRRTKYGKAMPLSPVTLNPMYKKAEIETAKETVNEYNRTMAMARRLGITA